MGWQERPATGERVRLLRGQPGVDRRVLTRALGIALESPDRPAWRAFLESVFLALGVLLTASGVVFFFAYNWSGLGRFAKFGLVELALGAAFAAALRLGLERESGRWALTLAGLLIGPLLAVYGQVYQLHADSWRLFAGWAGLLLPWTLAAAHAPLWLAWWAISNVGLNLGLDGDHLTLGALNLVAWVVVQLLNRPSGRWTLYACALATMVNWTVAACSQLSDNQFDAGVFLCLTAAAVTLGFYRGARRNGFFLAVGCASLISCVTTLAGTNLLKFESVIGFMLTAALLIVQVSTATWWLRGQVRT